MSEHPADDELRDAVMARLNEVQDPCSVAAGRPVGLVDMGLVRAVELAADGGVAVHLRLTSPACYLMTFLESDIVRRVSSCTGVGAVTVHPDEGLDWHPRLMAPHLRPGIPARSA